MVLLGVPWEQTYGSIGSIQLLVVLYMPVYDAPCNVAIAPSTLLPHVSLWLKLYMAYPNAQSSAPSVLIVSFPHGSPFKLVNPAAFSHDLRPLSGPGVGNLTPCAA